MCQDDENNGCSKSLYNLKKMYCCIHLDIDKGLIPRFQSGKIQFKQMFVRNGKFA